MEDSTECESTVHSLITNWFDLIRTLHRFLVGMFSLWTEALACAWVGGLKVGFKKLDMFMMKAEAPVCMLTTLWSSASIW